MIDWLIGSGIGGYLLAALGGLVAVVIAFLRGTWSGASKERAKQLQRDVKARDVADEIDDAVAGRSAAENKRRLSKWAPK